MKKILAILLAFAMVLTGCAPVSKELESTTTSEQETEIISTTESAIDVSETSSPAASDEEDDVALVSSFTGLNDPNLIQYVEDSVYADLVDEFASEDYIIENVAATYVSKEYLEELNYNSQANIFFGYTLAELDAQFQGTRYVFTLGEDGETVVQAFEAYDDTYERALKNVAIGGGVILVCVTVSVATAGTAPAVSVILAASAKTATSFALSSGIIGGVSAGIVEGYQTKDFEAALKAAVLGGSEGVKWGAISGAVTGGAVKTKALFVATTNGLTMTEAAIIARESKWPLSAIKSLHSMNEYEIYKTAELIPTQLEDGTWAFLREIDWTLVDDFGRTNAQRVAAGVAPIDSSGVPYELHHIGQRANSPLAILTNAEHHAKDNYKILHYAQKGKDVSDAVWQKQKHEFWLAILKLANGA